MLTRRAFAAGMMAPLASAGCGTSSAVLSTRPWAAADDMMRFELTTPVGPLELTINQARVPRIADWFISLVRAGAFDGTQFYRAGHLADQPDAPAFVEGGMLGPLIMSTTGPLPASAADAGLPLLQTWETTQDSGMRHRRGSVSFARDITGAGAVVPDLVIMLRDMPELDAGGTHAHDGRGFPVAGQVTAGLDVFDRLARGSRSGSTRVAFLQGQILQAPLDIVSLRQRPDGGDR